MVPDSHYLTGSVGPGDNVLLLCSVFASADDTACIQLLVPEDPSQATVLSVAITQSPWRRLAIWEQYAGENPADGEIIVFQQPDIGVSESIGESVEFPVTVSSAEDLTELGVRITERLDRWASDGVDGPPVVCFHSVSALLQFAGLEESFRLLSGVAERCSEADAVAHYHMDPRAHSERTIERLRPLFDAVYEWDGDEWSRN